MALSGTFKSSKVTEVGDYPSYVYVQWSATQDKVNNRSTINWHCYGGSDYNNAYRWTTTGPVVVKINGQTVVNKTSRFNMTRNMDLGSGSLTVQHNADGAKSVAVSISAAIYYGTTNSTYSGSIILDPIARSSQIDYVAPSVTIGQKCNVQWTPANKNFAYKLKFSLGTWEQETGFISPGTTSKYTYTGFTIPTALYSYISDDTKKTMKVTLSTYSSASNNSLIGKSDPKSFNVLVPNNIKPTVESLSLTPSTVSINGTSYSNMLVQGVNQLTIKVNGAKAGTGSKISSYTFSDSSKSFSVTQSSNTLTIGPIKQTEELTYLVTVKDDRKQDATIDGKIYCYAYSAPSVTLKVTRNQKNVTCTYKASYASLNGKNSATVKIYADGTLKKTLTSVPNNTSTVVTFDLGDALKSYEIYAEITDGLNNKGRSNQNNVNGLPRVMNITRDGTGVAFGKFAEEKNCVDVPKLMSRNNVLITTANRGYFGKNTQGVTEPMIYRNGSDNLWIGAKSSTKTTHITEGGTYISTGGKSDVYISKDIGSGDTRPAYAVIDAENYARYLPMMPTVLYSRSKGNKGSITLDANAANYSYLEIFYRESNDTTGDPTVQSLRYDCAATNDSGTKLNRFDISSMEASSTSKTVYLRTSRYEISGTSITFKRSRYVSIVNNVAPTVSETTSTTNNYFKITKVIGYSATK